MNQVLPCIRTTDGSRRLATRKLFRNARSAMVITGGNQVGRDEADGGPVMPALGSTGNSDKNAGCLDRTSIDRIGDDIHASKLALGTSSGQAALGTDNDRSAPATAGATQTDTS